VVGHGILFPMHLHAVALQTYENLQIYIISYANMICIEEFLRERLDDENIGPTDQLPRSPPRDGKTLR
jgi:hypothetical protein